LGVSIDGKAPSETAALRYHARPSGTPLVGWPAIKRINARTPLNTETWTVRVSDFNEDATDFRFTLEGSRTGPDGEGRGSLDFVSDSGRVAIRPGDWAYAYDKSVGQRKGKRAFPETHTVTWKTSWVGTDTIAVESTSPREVVLASGLPDGPHRLVLHNGGHARTTENGESVTMPASALPESLVLRVHKPPMAGDATP
jgi:hypothetical protein